MSNKRYAGVKRYIKANPKSVEAYEDWFELARNAEDIDICKEILKGIAPIVADPSVKMKERRRGHDLMKALFPQRSRRRD